MKKYRLLKDLPGIPAGTESEDLNYQGNPMWSHDGHLYIISKTNREWVQEIPDYSFVKDGDVYANYNPPFVTRIEKGRAFNGCTAKSGKDYKFEGWESPVESHYARDSFKPENLVYRPGKNPWDTPEVDKLGWGPMEKQPKPKYHVGPLCQCSLNGFAVSEELDVGFYKIKAKFNSQEDAELFKRALEGK